MADLHDIIEKAKVILASSRTPDREQLNEIHGALTHEIRHANRRLRECDALLANGHRTEAIQLAEQEPPLLDVIAVLDFPELPEWNDFVAELGLNVAPELQIDIAAELNRAYADDVPLEEHLRNFRLYSLARAPLRSRISMLRKISQLDPVNPVWETDLRNYEEVRQRQMKEESRDARQHQDLTAMKRLMAELRGEWTIEPDRQLAGFLKNAISSIQSRNAMGQLRQVVRDLQEARVEQNVEWAREARDEWETLSARCSPEDLRELNPLTRKTFQWLDDIDRADSSEKARSKRLDGLQRALDAGHSFEEVQRRYQALARKNDVEIPPEMEQQYEELMEFFRKKRKRNLMIATAAGGAGLLLILIVIVVVALLQFGS